MNRELNAYLDGELSALECERLERRLAGDPALKAELDELARLSSQIRSQATYHRAPDALRARFEGSRASTTRAPVAPVRRRVSTRLAFGGAAIAFAFAALLVPDLWHAQGVADEVIDAHVRASLGERLFDVASTDQHKLKPWLSARLNFSPTVPDLSDQGFSLAGARVDYVERHSAAALVYRRRDHVVSVFAWPASSRLVARSAFQERGFHVLRVQSSGLDYWIVSDLNSGELDDFARSFASRL
ncbi:MAG TPA: anti-sigma factor [Burkholderiaceae bacterium]|jgi:anti-sigma factor RsiW|nr:anti-sigma factor [Burkholderiaceae bacterium]